GVLAVEVAIDETGAHPRSLGDVRHACGVKAMLDEAFLRGDQDPVALRFGALAGLRGVSRGAHRLCSLQPPPSALYRLTRLACSDKRVVINCCCAAYSVRCASRSTRKLSRPASYRAFDSSLLRAAAASSACCARRCSASVLARASPSATSRNAAWIERSYCATAMSRSACTAAR